MFNIISYYANNITYLLISNADKDVAFNIEAGSLLYCW